MMRAKDPPLIISAGAVSAHYPTSNNHRPKLCFFCLFQSARRTFRPLLCILCAPKVTAPPRFERYPPRGEHLIFRGQTLRKNTTTRCSVGCHSMQFCSGNLLGLTLSCSSLSSQLTIYVVTLRSTYVNMYVCAYNLHHIRATTGVDVRI